MPIRMSGLSGAFDSKLVDQLIEAEKMPVQVAKQRKQRFVDEKKEVDKLNTVLNELTTSLNGLKTRQDFFKMKIESSHPDIIDGTCTNDALVGSWEFEVRGMAKTDKELAYGWPDKDQTPVGFGYMQIERDDKDVVEVTIEPGATLNDVARQINDLDAGVKALVVNTKYKPDGYRLLVVSEQSGNEARIHIDEDTTFLEFKEQVTGTNLDVLFEDVPVTDTDNQLEELIDGVIFNIKRSEPGTRIQVSILHDIEKTMESIKSFVEKYNQVSNFVHQQYQENPETGKRGILSGDGTIKSVMRGLQTSLMDSKNPGGKFGTLADIGITTDPKTGNLKMDDAKVKQALTEDYEGVAKLFIRGKGGGGLSDALATKVKAFQDPASGVVRSRLRGLDNTIKTQDEGIERRERMLASKEESIRRRFAALEGQMANLQSQGGILAARLGGGGGQGGGGGKASAGGDG